MIQQKSRQQIQKSISSLNKNQDSLTNIVYQLNLGNIDYLKSKQILLDNKNIKNNITILKKKRFLLY